MRRLAIGVAVALILGPAAAWAQPAPDAPPTPPEHYGPSTAAWLSAGSTVAGWGLAAVMLRKGADDRADLIAPAVIVTVAPSVGHWYSRELWSPWLLLRVAGAAAAGWSTNAFLCGERDPECSANEEGSYMVAGFIGLAAFAAGTVGDIVTAPRTARAANRARWARELRVAPQLAPGHTGVAISGRF